MPERKNTSQKWSGSKLISQLADPSVLQHQGWEKIEVEGKWVLHSRAGAEPAPLELRCPLRGWWDITVTPAPLREQDRPSERGALSCFIEGRRFVMPSFNMPGGGGPEPFFVGSVKLTGKPIRIEKVSPASPVGLASISFRKSSPSAMFDHPGSPVGGLTVWGICDQNDQAWTIDSSCIDDLAVGFRYHRELGFNAVSWHMYAGCCNFPTRVGTTFPRINLIDSDHLRMLSEAAPGRSRFELVMRDLIHRYNGMYEAARLAHEQGLAFAPCMRMNNEWRAKWVLGHFTEEFAEKFWCPQFFNEHPEYWSRLKDDKLNGGAMDYSHEQVRSYRLGILTEVLEDYPQNDSLLLDMHRHPVTTGYPEAAVQAFRHQTGVDVRTVEPRDKDTADPGWLKFRAGYFTQFLRDLKAARGALKSKCPVVIRTAQTFEQGLAEGVDIEAWLDEKLVDTLILENYRGKANEHSLRPVIEAARKAGVNVLGGFGDCYFVGRSPWRTLERIMNRWLDEGACGVAFYESNLVTCYENIRRNLPKWVGQHQSFGRD